MSGMSSENRHDEASVGRTTTSARSFTASATSSALIHGSASPLGMETTTTGRVRSASRRCAARSAASFGVAIRRGPVASLVGVGVLAAVVRSAHLSPDGAAPGPVVGVVRRCVSRRRFRLGKGPSDRRSPARGVGPRVPPTGGTRWRIGAGSADGRAVQLVPGEPVDEVADGGVGPRIRLLLRERAPEPGEQVEHPGAWVADAPRLSLRHQMVHGERRVTVFAVDGERHLAVVLVLAQGDDVVGGGQRRGRVEGVQQGEVLGVQVEVADADGDGDLVEEAAERGPVSPRSEDAGHAAETDLPADRLVLLVTPRAEHLAEVLLVDAVAGHGAVVALDHEPRCAVEVLQPRERRRYADASGEARAELLVEDQCRVGLGYGLDQVGRRVTVMDLVPATADPGEHDLVLHAGQRGLTGDRRVAERLGLDVAEQARDAVVVQRCGAWGAGLAGAGRVVDLQGAGDVAPVGGEEAYDVVLAGVDRRRQPGEDAALRQELGEERPTSLGARPGGDELEWDCLGEDRAAEGEALDGRTGGAEVERAPVGTDQVPDELAVELDAKVSHVGRRRVCRCLRPPLRGPRPVGRSRRGGSRRDRPTGPGPRSGGRRHRHTRRRPTWLTFASSSTASSSGTWSVPTGARSTSAPPVRPSSASPSAARSSPRRSHSSSSPPGRAPSDVGRSSPSSCRRAASSPGWRRRSTPASTTSYASSPPTGATSPAPCRSTTRTAPASPAPHAPRRWTTTASRACSATSGPSRSATRLSPASPRWRGCRTRSCSPGSTIAGTRSMTATRRPTWSSPSPTPTRH